MDSDDIVFQQQATRTSQKPIIIPITNDMTVDDVIGFVFPKKKFSGNNSSVSTRTNKFLSGFRLFVMGEYMQNIARLRRICDINPEEEVVEIGMVSRGHSKKQHILTSSEIDTMVSEMEDEIYAAIYNQNLTTMTQSDRLRLKNDANPIIRTAMNYSEREIRKLLSEKMANKRLRIQRREGENIRSFFQRIIQNERYYQISQLQKASPDLFKLRDRRALEPRQYTIWNKPHPRVFGDHQDRDLSDYGVVSRLVGNKMSSLRDLDDKKARTNDIVSNVILIRADNDQHQTRQTARHSYTNPSMC